MYSFVKVFSSSSLGINTSASNCLLILVIIINLQYSEYLPTASSQRVEPPMIKISLTLGLADNVSKAISKSQYTQIMPFSSLTPSNAVFLLSTIFNLFGNGLYLSGRDSQVFLPIITALTFESGQDVSDNFKSFQKKQFFNKYSLWENESESLQVVISAKCFISLGILGHGIQPLNPIP